MVYYMYISYVFCVLQMYVHQYYIHKYIHVILKDEIETDTINNDNKRVNYNGMYNGNRNTKPEQGTPNKKLLGFSKRGTPVGVKKKYDLKSIKLKPTKSKKSIALKPPGLIGI